VSPHVVAYLVLPVYRLSMVLGMEYSFLGRLFTAGPLVILIVIWRRIQKRLQTHFRQAITQETFRHHEPRMARQESRPTNAAFSS